jgi:hypothetical protein
MNKIVKPTIKPIDIVSTLIDIVDRIGEMEELKTRIKKTGIPLKKFCKMCGVSYGRMVKYLNEFEPMPGHIRSKVEEVLKNE